MNIVDDSCVDGFIESLARKFKDALIANRSDVKNALRAAHRKSTFRRGKLDVQISRVEDRHQTKLDIVSAVDRLSFQILTPGLLDEIASETGGHWKSDDHQNLAPTRFFSKVGTETFTIKKARISRTEAFAIVAEIFCLGPDRIAQIYKGQKRTQ